MAATLPLHASSSLRVPAHVLSRQVGGEAVLLNLDTEEYFGLDAVGTRFWALVAGGTTYEQAVHTLTGEYDVDPEVLDVDLRALIDELIANGLLEVDAT